MRKNELACLSQMGIIFSVRLSGAALPHDWPRPGQDQPSTWGSFQEPRSLSCALRESQVFRRSLASEARPLADPLPLRCFGNENTEYRLRQGPWALRTSNTTFEEPTEDVVQLQPHCDHETCEPCDQTQRARMQQRRHVARVRSKNMMSQAQDLIPRRSYDVAERGDGLVMWPMPSQSGSLLFLVTRM